MIDVDISPVTGFLGVRTRPEWVEAAVADLPTLLRDHAALELKAAQQAQALIWRYGLGPSRRDAPPLGDEQRLRLTQKLSRLAREELRHFEQVMGILGKRGIHQGPLSPSRYARELHARVRPLEPGRCLDTLVVCAIIEARSCERFHSLLPVLANADTELAELYASLLASEARHFEDYLALARGLVAQGSRLGERVELFLDIDNRMIDSPDTELRFHSGVPVESGAA